MDHFEVDVAVDVGDFCGGVDEFIGGFVGVTDFDVVCCVVGEEVGVPINWWKLVGESWTIQGSVGCTCVDVPDPELLAMFWRAEGALVFDGGIDSACNEVFWDICNRPVTRSTRDYSPSR